MLGFDHGDFSAVYRDGIVLSTTGSGFQHMSFEVSRPIVLVGLMGAGKSAIGKRLAKRLDVPFFDSDAEVEAAAGCSISEIFARYGEAAFRKGERKVVARLLEHGPCVMASGGGAFIDEASREQIRALATSVWLRADLDTLVGRTSRRDHRPLLQGRNHREVLAKLMTERHPVYALADVVVDSGDRPHDEMVEAIVAALSGSARDSLRVELGSRAYDILVGEGLLGEAGRRILPVLGQRRVVVVTDERVAALHLADFRASLARAGIADETIVLPPGEGTKDFAHLGELAERLLEMRVERSTTLVALGGGVIGDLVGFAAAVVLRGLDFVQVPTTLLAQVDSSVGGKTGINTRHGKNLVGAFHQPRLVLADVGVLATLPRRELLAGYAEVVKYGLIGDAGFFTWLEENGAALVAGDARARRRAVVASCAAKAAIVAEDEREAGRRALLNLGHTFGHALEAETGYGDALLHGEAVSIGMVLAFDLSVRLGLCPAGDAERARRHLEAVGLPVALRAVKRPGWTAEGLLDHMRQDKKVKDGRLTFILVEGIGRAFISREVGTDAVHALLADALAA